jgi:hypothetical protein
MNKVTLVDKMESRYKWNDLKNLDIVQSKHTGFWYLVKKDNMHFSGLIGLDRNCVYPENMIMNVFSQSLFSKLNSGDVLTIKKVD